jgi:hypothetical protein
MDGLRFAAARDVSRFARRQKRTRSGPRIAVTIGSATPRASLSFVARPLVYPGDRNQRVQTVNSFREHRCDAVREGVYGGKALRE